MAEKAVLGVDIQNDFCPPDGALAVDDGNAVIEPANKMIAFAKSRGWPVLLSGDQHPAESEHFKKWPVHCVRNTSGAAFHPLLDLEGATIISKGMRPDEDAYSPFEGFATSGESLDDILRRANISELYIFGLATNFCVRAAVLDARLKGYKVFVVIDACRAVKGVNPSEEETVEEMKSAGAIITTTEEVVR